MVFWPGVGPLRPDGTFVTGEVSAGVAVEKAHGHARPTGLVSLAVVRKAAGSLGRVAHVGEVFGTLNAPPSSTGHPKAINGRSDPFVEVVGDRGCHARSAAEMAPLPFDITMEIEALVEPA